MNWLLNRLKERSTWLAIFTLVGLFGMNIEPELRDHIIDAILAIAAAVAFAFREETLRPELPPIELIAKPESTVQPRSHLSDDRVHSDSADRVRVQPDHRPESNAQRNDDTGTGWNG